MSNPLKLKPEYGVAVISFFIYLALVPWVVQTWKPLGDEPHYLLAAHSLVYDHDLDLANNYAQRDFRGYLDVPYLDGHVKILPGGEQLPSHDLGLVFLIAPAYALGGRTGVEILLACFGALLAAQIFLLAREVTESTRIALLTWLAVGLSAPILLYGFMIYPEMIGSLITIWCVRTILFNSAARISPPKILLVGLSFASLPWLSVRFFVIVAVLVLLVLWRWHDPRRRVWPVLLMTALSSALYLWVNQILLASQPPAVVVNQFASTSVASLTVTSLARGLVGWWLDQQRGLLFLAPIYLIALVGIPRLIQRMRGTGIAIILPFVVLNAFVLVFGGFWVGFEVGPRYLMVALPLLAAPLATALHSGLGWAAHSRLTRCAFFGIASITLLLTGLNSLLLVQDITVGLRSAPSAQYSLMLGFDLTSLLPALGQQKGFGPGETRSDAGVIQDGDRARWFAPRGVHGLVVQSNDLSELSHGNYDLHFRTRAANVSDANAEILTIDLFSVEGISLAHQTLSTTELGARGELRDFVMNFDNPYFDRWGFPPSLQIVTSGQADVQLTDIVFDPNTWTTWSRIAIWGILVLGTILFFNRDLIPNLESLTVRLRPGRVAANEFN